MENFGILESKLNEIKNKGWIKGITRGTSSIGITFENLLGKPVDNLQLPDYYGIEIKTKRIGSKSHITLFNAMPDSSLFEIARLQNTYGYPDKEIQEFKVLNISIYSNKLTESGSHYYFKLEVDHSKERIILNIYDQNINLIDNKTSWSFKLLEEKLYRKLKYLALIKAERKFINKEQYFKYEYAHYFKLKNFNAFLNLVKNGKMRITLSIDVFKSGQRYGQIYDHGTSFNIKEEDLPRLFQKIK